MRNPLFVCLLFPRQDANPTELKMLGEAIGEWSLKEEAAGLQVFFDPKPVQDLLLGELPQPMALRMTLKAHELTEESRQLLEGRGGWANLTPEEVQGLHFEEPRPGPGALAEARQNLGGLASSRAVLMFIDSGSGGRGRAVKGLRRWLPEGLVADIFLDGTSWNNEVD